LLLRVQLPAEEVFDYSAACQLRFSGRIRHRQEAVAVWVAMVVLERGNPLLLQYHFHEALSFLH
jgi:hypothetical protein